MSIGHWLLLGGGLLIVSLLLWMLFDRARAPKRSAKDDADDISGWGV